MQQLKFLLATLRAAQMIHQTGHWRVGGKTYYGDHQLLERLYNSVGQEIDQLAEKMVEKYGEDSVDLHGQIDHMHTVIKGIAKISCNFRRAQAVEKMLQKLFKMSYDKLKERDELSLGMDDFLMASANNHETNCYLLGRRLKEV
jgi:DNA-binding ferritin-like protein